jgi:hypothetical protein
MEARVLIRCKGKDHRYMGMASVVVLTAYMIAKGTMYLPLCLKSTCSLLSDLSSVGSSARL